MLKIMPEEQSITHWIHALKAGDERAARELWDRYFRQLMSLARSRMNTLPRATYDEEDAAISTFDVLCRKLREGSYPELSDRGELWRLMLKVLVRKINRRADYESATKRQTPDSIPRHASTPTTDNAAVTVQMADECEHLLSRLNDANLEQVAIWKLEGFNNDEIATKLNRTRRTVQRMLNLIRALWLEELNGDE